MELFFLIKAVGMLAFQLIAQLIEELLLPVTIVQNMAIGDK